MRTRTVCLAVLFVLAVATAASKENRVTTQAKGTFEVKVQPLTEGVRQGVWSPGRMSIDKHFAGDLVGTTQGEMMTAMTDEKGSAGYVAIERFEGTLAGRKGTFILQHHAIMNRGVPGPWTVTIVPDSGTGELKGISGSLTITISGDTHQYVLDYAL